MVIFFFCPVFLVPEGNLVKVSNLYFLLFTVLDLPTFKKCALIIEMMIQNNEAHYIYLYMCSCVSVCVFFTTMFVFNT